MGPIALYSMRDQAILIIYKSIQRAQTSTMANPVRIHSSDLDNFQT